MNDTVRYRCPPVSFAPSLQAPSVPVFDRRDVLIGHIARDDPSARRSRGPLRVSPSEDARSFLPTGDGPIEVPYRCVGALRRDRIQLDVTVDALAEEVRAP